MFRQKTITVETDRDSVCAGDDMTRHNKFLDIPENYSVKKLVKTLSKHYPIASNWAIWAGSYENHKCIRDRYGNWLIDEKTSIKTFFQDIETFH